MNTYFFDGSGKIFQSFIGEAVAAPSGLGVFALHTDDLIDPQSHYVDGHRVVAIPPKPSNRHTFNYTTKQWEQDHVLAESQAKDARNRLLSGSDWTQLPDVPLATKEAWATYRQALRDITAQPGYPFNVDWPAPPA